MIVKGGSVAPRDADFVTAEYHFLKVRRKAGEKFPEVLTVGAPGDTRDFGPLSYHCGQLMAGDVAPVDGVYYAMPDGPEVELKAGEEFPDQDADKPGKQGDFVRVRDLPEPE